MSKYSRRHYIDTANFLVEISQNPAITDRALAFLIDTYIKMFKRDNKKFDSDRFKRYLEDRIP